MKKISILATIVIFALSAVACKKNKDENKAPKADDKAAMKADAPKDGMKAEPKKDEKKPATTKDVKKTDAKVDFAFLAKMYAGLGKAFAEAKDAGKAYTAAAKWITDHKKDFDALSAAMKNMTVADWTAASAKNADFVKAMAVWGKGQMNLMKLAKGKPVKEAAEFAKLMAQIAPGKK